MIYEWLENLKFDWASDLPSVYKFFLGCLFCLIVIPIGVMLDISLFPVEIIIWFIRRKGDKE